MTADLMKVVGTDTYSLAPLCALVELGDLAGAPTIAALPYEALSRAAARGVLFSSGWMFLIPRMLGVAAATGRQWERAETHFREAIEVAARVGARPELGHAHVDYARMLVARGDRSTRDRAIESLKQASHVFIELGMPPALRRAARLANALGVHIPETLPQRLGYPDDLNEREVDVLIGMAQGRNRQEIAGDLVLRQTTVVGHMHNIFSKIKVRDEAAAAAYAQAKGLTTQPEQPHGPQAPADVGKARVFRIILVSDIAASATLIRRRGDDKAHDLLRLHNTLIRQCLATHQGVEVTHTGDGIEASFTSASQAVECAVAIQKAFARHNRQHPDDAIRVRIGINAGEPIATEGRLFGAAVHAAFRICSRARPDQILISDVVAQLVAGKGLALTNRGLVAIKGFDRVRLYEVPWDHPNP
jgi:class 3 adenylate cyclase